MVADAVPSPRSASASALRAPAWIILAVLIALTFALRLASALAHSTPRYFPDEYIYAALARSISNGGLSVRGVPASFPALLQPILTAPFWLLDDLQLAYRLTQGLHALAVSLTAVPVYVLARRLAVSPTRALACAVLTLATPAMVFASYVTADAVALPLVLSAIAVGVVALTRPKARFQLAFLALAGLATFARVQYAVLPLAWLIAAAAISGWSPLRMLRVFRWSVALLVGIAVTIVAIGASRILSYYESVLELEVDVPSMAGWAATDAMLLAYASGIVLIPGAVLGLVCGIARPRSRTESAFAVLTATFAAFLFLEASLYAANGSSRFQERYLIALLPLVPILFCLGAQRLGTGIGRWAVAAVASLLAGTAMLVPLSGYTQLTGKQDSPTLGAISQLEGWMGTGETALIVSVAALALAGIAAVTAWRPRASTWLSLSSAMVVLLTTAICAVDYDVSASARAKRLFAGPNPSWIDSARLRDVAILQTPGASRAQVTMHLVWNDSITRLLRMPGAVQHDAYGDVRVRTSRTGTLLAAGHALHSPLLVEESAAWAELEGARLFQRGTNAALWVPTGDPRLVLLMRGRYADGWLASSSSVTVWPRPVGARRGTFRLSLRLPRYAQRAAVIDVRGSNFARVLAIPPGETRLLTIDVNAQHPETFTLRAREPLFLDGDRVIAVRSSPPTFSSRRDDNPA